MEEGLPRTGEKVMTVFARSQEANTRNDIKDSVQSLSSLWHTLFMNLNTQKLAFEEYLKSKADSSFEEKNTLNEAIRYSLLAPGKRIRPLLCLGFSQGFKGSKEVALSCGAAIEMIHAYSLIHDDLPAMDNDDFRRGLPTNHKVYGEATAILAGDSLLNYAPEFLIKELGALNLPAKNILELATLLLQASGHRGMVKGQSLDMKFEAEDLSQYDQATLESTLREIHKLKTGSIITWSCLAGLYSHTDQAFIQKHKCLVESIGMRIGLLFQMVDDVLDVTSSLKDLGKTPGKDLKTGKLTYTNLFGLEGAKKQAKGLIHDLENDLHGLESFGDWSMIREIISALEMKLED